jgi:uridine kinase
VTGRLDAFEPPAPSPERAVVLARLIESLVALRPDERVAVGIDGVDGAGKTVLARELAVGIGPHREVHRASVDGFHRPRVERYERGRSPEAYYRDSYDHDAIRERLVEPFRAGDPFVTAQFDVERDALVERPAQAAGPGALLLVDGIFLLRPELADLWDASLFLDVPFAVSVPRGNARFGTVGPEESDPEHRLNSRYVLGQRLYFAEVDPADRATWILENADLDRPVLRTGRRSG